MNTPPAAKNMETGANYEITHRGVSQGTGTFTGKREGILGNPIMKMADGTEKGFSTTLYSFTKKAKGGRRATRRGRRHGRKHTRSVRRR